MGTVYAEITLNAVDRAGYDQGLLKKQDVRSITVTAIVDTGAMSLVISKDLRQKLGLRIMDEKSALIANSQRVRCHVTEAEENQRSITEEYDERCSKTPCPAIPWIALWLRFRKSYRQGIYGYC